MMGNRFVRVVADAGNDVAKSPDIGRWIKASPASLRIHGGGDLRATEAHQRLVLEHGTL
jgi:hypothetical protein